MPRPNTQQLRRDKLIAAARAVAVREGAAGATLRAIAAEAGMRPSAVLYYFENLNALLTAMVRVATEQFIAQLDDAVQAEGTASARLVSAIRAGVSSGLVDDISTILYEFWSSSIRDPEMSELDRRLVDHELAVYEGILKEGIDSGEFTTTMSASDIAEVLVGLEDGHVMGILTGRMEADRVMSILIATASSLVGTRLSSPTRIH